MEDDEPTDEMEALEESFGTTQPIDETHAPKKETGPFAAQTDAFSYLQALDESSLALEDEARTERDKPSTRRGYNPYDTLELDRAEPRKKKD